jgi:RimJ/RimL family protein N-acetyltransferase
MVLPNKWAGTTSSAIQTERLILRPFKNSDAQSFEAIYGDPQTMTFMLGGVKSKDETAASIGRKIRHREEYGIGLWCMIDKASDSVIGQCGLAWLEEINDIQIGYLVARKFWNMGYATEAVRASLKFGFTALKMCRVSAIVHPENIGSRRVLVKSGMDFAKDSTLWNSQFACYSVLRSCFIRNEGKTSDYQVYIE